MTNSGWNLKLITPPAVEPVTLEQAREHLRVFITDDDDFITRLIVAARQAAENYTRRAFVAQEWEAGYQSFPCDGFELAKPPLIGLSAITYTDDDDVEQTLPASDYTVDDYSAPAKVYRKRTASWPVLTENGTRVRVRFVAGYPQGEGSPGDEAANVPDAIKHAILLHLGHMYENREAVNVGNITTELPLAYDSLLHPYRVYGWGDA